MNHLQTVFLPGFNDQNVMLQQQIVTVLLYNITDSAKCVLYPRTWVDEVIFCRFRCVINDGPYMLL